MRNRRITAGTIYHSAHSEEDEKENPVLAGPAVKKMEGFEQKAQSDSSIDDGTMMNEVKNDTPQEEGPKQEEDPKQKSS